MITISLGDRLISRLHVETRRLQRAISLNRRVQALLVRLLSLGDYLHRGNGKISLYLIYVSSLLFTDIVYGRVTGFVQIYASRFRWTVRYLWRERKGHTPTCYASTGRDCFRRDRRRIGVLGQFRGLLWYSPALFEKLPADADYYIYEIEYYGSEKERLKDNESIKGYDSYRLAGTERDNIFTFLNLYQGEEYRTEAGRLARDLIAVDLDAIYYIGPPIDYIYDVMNVVKEKKFVQVPTGSEVVYSPWIRGYIYIQSQLDCRVVSDRLFDCILNKPLIDVPALVFKDYYYNARGLLGEEAIAWDERDNRVIYWGSLYKLGQNADCLGLIEKILAANPGLSFHFWGADPKGIAGAITGHFQRQGLGSRIFYGGHKTFGCDSEDTGWLEFKSMLKKSKLAINPWPVGGGSTVVESYLLGIPCISMSFPPEDDCSRWRQYAIVDVPSLAVPIITAKDVDEYEAIAGRVLTDCDFADTCIRLQRQTAERLTDPLNFWQQLENCHALFIDGERNKQ